MEQHDLNSDFKPVQLAAALSLFLKEHVRAACPLLLLGLGPEHWASCPQDEFWLAQSSCFLVSLLVKLCWYISVAHMLTHTPSQYG